MLEFKSAHLNGIGGQTSVRDRQWGTLVIRFEDSETEQMRAVELNVLLPKNHEITMRELEEAARKEGIATLSAALQLLQESSLAELEAREKA